MKTEILTVDQYILSFPKEVQAKLETFRQIIKTCAPDANESISYGMPAYKLNKKPLVYFGGYAKHIGFYATPSGNDKFKSELSKYKHGKGSIQFPLNQALPIDLIKEIVEYRVIQNTIK